MFRLVAFALVLLSGLLGPAFARTDIEKAIATANDEVARLYREGKYAEGLELARQTLERAKKELVQCYFDTADDIVWKEF